MNLVRGSKVNPAITPAPRRTHDDLGYQIAIFLFAIIYGATLSLLPSDELRDWTNYLSYAENAWVQLQISWGISPLIAFANEPLWLLINSALALILPPEAVVRLIIFVPATLVAWLVLRHGPRPFAWLLVILFLWPVIQNYLIHLRQGLAIAVFLLGWFTTGRPLRWLLMGATPFIHLSFAFVLPLLWLATAMQRLKLGADLRTIVFISSGIFAGTSLAWIAEIIGARQSESYSFSTADVSGIGFLYWLSIFALMCFEGRRFLRGNAFQAGVVVFYLSTYFLIEVTARIFDSVLILVLLASLKLTRWRRVAFLAIVVCFGVLQWLMKMKEPLMGFGVL